MFETTSHLNCQRFPQSSNDHFPAFYHHQLLEVQRSRNSPLCPGVKKRSRNPCDFTVSPQSLQIRWFNHVESQGCATNDTSTLMPLAIPVSSVYSCRSSPAMSLKLKGAQQPSDFLVQPIVTEPFESLARIFTAVCDQLPGSLGNEADVNDVNGILVFRLSATAMYHAGGTPLEQRHCCSCCRLFHQVPGSLVPLLSPFGQPWQGGYAINPKVYPQLHQQKQYTNTLMP